MPLQCDAANRELLGQMVFKRQQRGLSTLVQFIEEDDKPENIRTMTQNKSLHKYCGMLAKALNDAGLDMRKVLKVTVDIPWTKESTKEHLWRPIQEAMTSKKSTTEQTTVEYQEIYKVLDRHLAEKYGVSVDWPCRESQMAQSLGEMREAG